MIQSTSSNPSPAASQQGSSGSGALGEVSDQKLGKNDFLKLLVTQLRNQNPNSPMKGRKMATQLAQFSSVEQLTNIRDQLKNQQGSNRALAQSVNNGVATDLIGRNVEVSGNTFQWTGEGEATLGMELSSPASEVKVTIRDAAGNAVRTRTLENVGAGPKEIKWDGRADGGSHLPTGTYSFDVSATNGDGDTIRARSYVEGAVERITFGRDGTKLWVNGTEVSMDRVRSVSTK